MAARGKAKQSIAQKERARRAVELKIAGATWKEIADELDFDTEAGARLLVVRYFEDTAKTQFEEMHPIVLERAELLWRRAWSKLNTVQSSDDIDKWDKAMRNCISVLQHIARISGLGNGPAIQINVTTADDVKRLRDEFYELRGLPTGGVVDAEVVEVVEQHEGVTEAEWLNPGIGLLHTPPFNGNGSASDDDK